MKKIVLWIGTLLLTATFSASQAYFLPPAPAGKAAVITEQYWASEAGLEILKAGGNAVDAAVAVGYALAVVDPCCGNIGGGGFMLIHRQDGQNIVLDFRGMAPAAAKPGLYLNARGEVDSQRTLTGYLSVSVPGTVMGLNTALQKYGTKSLAEVMAPAIRLAQQGFILSADDVQLLNSKITDFHSQPNVARIFLNHNRPYKSGERLIQTQLANTLKQISLQGTAVFYHGDIAAQIVAASEAGHGILTKRDFADYQVKERPVLTCEYRGYQIITTPPPGSGVTICEILNILNHFPLAQDGFHAALDLHYNVEAMRYAYADRNQYIGDPDFVANPVKRLLSADYAEKIAEQISPQQAGHSQQLVKTSGARREGVHTTHYAIIDRWGNAVGVTYTLNSYFGSKRIAKDTGFFLNDDIDDFTILPGAKNSFNLQQGETNLIAPHKRPLSSMSPTMVFKNGQLWLSLGAAGGSTIITTIVQSLENIIDYGMDISSAVNQSRYHFQWFPDQIYAEPYGLSLDTRQKLQVMGYSVHEGSPFNTLYWGEESILLKDPQTGIIYGAADNRRSGAGATVGY